LGEQRHEVYVTGYRDLSRAGSAALRLRRAGFDPMLTVLP
jgi:hypothetical protein